MNNEDMIKKFSDRSLNLKDEGLYGVDPYAEDLSEEMQQRIRKEVIINPAYFFAVANVNPKAFVHKGLMMFKPAGNTLHRKNGFMPWSSKLPLNGHQPGHSIYWIGSPVGKELLWPG